MSKVLNTRIQLRKDTLENWISSNPVLKDGELAIVLENGTESIKLGNGLSSFQQLPYLYQTEIKSDKITTKDITAKSVSQGYNVKSTPTSLATGIFSEADGNFDVVHGIEAHAKEGDDYAFVFNGENLPGIEQRYESHGEGTFNVNPLSGLQGFYIGEESLSSILSVYLTEHQSLSNYYTVSETSSGMQISQELAKYQHAGDYLSSAEHVGNTLVFRYDGETRPDVSVNLSIYVDDYSRQISALSNAISVIGSDYLDSNDKMQMYNDLLSPDEVRLYKGPGQKDISLSVGTGTQLCTYTVSLEDFYLKSETSSNVQIEDRFGTLSTYSQTRNMLSSDGYQLKTVIRTWREAD